MVCNRRPPTPPTVSQLAVGYTRMAGALAAGRPRLQHRLELETSMVDRFDARGLESAVEKVIEEAAIALSLVREAMGHPKPGKVRRDIRKALGFTYP